MRLIVLAVLLALSGAAVVVGVAMLSAPSAWIVGGVLAAMFTAVFLFDTEPARVDPRAMDGL